ncbi:MAG: aldehyde dehydrogenase family protein, partial [Halobacteriota archaeon]
FKTTGQRCLSAERLIVHKEVYDDFRERFVDVAGRVAVGDPLFGDSFMGPMASESGREKLRRGNELAVSEGADVLVDRFERDDPPTSGGFWAGPFVYEMEFDPGHRCLREEVFGPHVALVEYSGDLDRALEIHDATPYGLAGSIVTEDYREQRRFRDEAEVGLAYANLPSIGAEIQLPFGGVKRSGHGFPYARELVEVVTHRRAWTVNHAREVEMAQGLSSEIDTEE